MSYSHSFYGLNLEKLKSIYGSKDETFTREVLKARAQDIKDNDDELADEIEDGDVPDSKKALREIVAGSIGQHEGAAAMFGYVLEILRRHVGQRIGDDVGSVAEHPYRSQLIASGPPIPIPVDKSDFPEIGFLALSQIPEEIKRIDETPPKAGRRVGVVLWLLGRRKATAYEIAQDMAAYRRTLNEALEKKLDIVSFRY